MRPLTIRLGLFTPLAAPLRRLAYPLHLDALLVSIIAADEQGIFDPKKDDPFAPGTGRVPLGVVGREEPIYQASVALAAGAASSDTYGFIRRVLELDVQAARTQQGVPIYDPVAGSNVSRPWMESMPVLAVTAVEFRCVGDPKAIKELLERVPFVGSFRRWGFGEVLDINVREESGVNSDTWGLYDERGPLRELPVNDWPAEGNWTKGPAALRPPYWYPGHRRLCWLPDPFRIAIPQSV